MWICKVCGLKTKKKLRYHYKTVEIKLPFSNRIRKNKERCYGAFKKEVEP
jgi:hypothetical protein